MLPLQRSDELAYRILSDPHHLLCQQNTISEDLILDYNYPLDFTSNSCPLLDTNNLCHNNVNNSSSSSSRKRNQTAANTHPENDEKLKKILHRDMERRRRKEMATLYSSLRSLLPVEYIKRKRSASEYMQAAVNYIEQMQTNLKELERRRDSIFHGRSSASSNTPSTTPSPGFVAVNGCRDGGLEILVDTGSKIEERFPLSTLLRTLLKEGVEVVSCVSTRTSHGSRLLHRLHSKVCGEICVDVGGLQQKLSGAINASGPNV